MYNSFGGLLVAAVLKFSDVVTKDIAQAFATVLTTGISLFVMKEIVLNFGVCVGVFLVVFSALFCAVVASSIVKSNFWRGGSWGTSIIVIVPPFATAVKPAAIVDSFGAARRSMIPW